MALLLARRADFEVALIDIRMRKWPRKQGAGVAVGIVILAGSKSQKSGEFHHTPARLFSSPPKGEEKSVSSIPNSEFLAIATQE